MLPIRPFPVVILDRGPEVPGVSLQGIVRGQTYMLVLGDAEIVVPTVACGEDKRGPFCSVVEGCTDIGGGLTLELLAEDGVQVEILIYRTPPADPLADTRNLVTLRHTIVSVNFHEDGRYETASSPHLIRNRVQTQH